MQAAAEAFNAADAAAAGRRPPPTKTNNMHMRGQRVNMEGRRQVKIVFEGAGWGGASCHPC